MSNQILQVPIGELIITKTNARQKHTVDDSLLASIKSVGLLYPLTVDAVDAGQWDVVDGAQRLVAIRHGLETGELLHTRYETIPCMVREDGAMIVDGLEISLHANLHQAMHPLDECEAILKLAEDEEDKAAIALRFGQDEQVARPAGQAGRARRRGEGAVPRRRDQPVGRDGLHPGHAGPAEGLPEGHQARRLLDPRHRPAMTEKAIHAQHVNFGLELYNGPIKRDLFGEDIWLEDRKLVAELQDQWAQNEIEALKAQGYDKVEFLGKDDWQTLNNTVEVTGKISAEVRATLACYLKADHYGLIVRPQGRAARRSTTRARSRRRESADETPAENVKPLVCTELSPAQQEIVNAYAATRSLQDRSGRPTRCWPSSWWSPTSLRLGLGRTRRVERGVPPQRHAEALGAAEQGLSGRAADPEDSEFDESLDGAAEARPAAFAS